MKSQWRRGVALATGATAALGVTLTPSDAATMRLRPPRGWYDALLGGAWASFRAHVLPPDEEEAAEELAGAAGGGGFGSAAGRPGGHAPGPYTLKVIAYEKYKSEYYVQGGEVKRLFRDLALRPGDFLEIRRAVVPGAPPGGLPAVSLRLRRRVRNPHAGPVVGAAEAAAARRLLAPPRGGAAAQLAGGGGGGGAARKRKHAPSRASAGDGDGGDGGYSSGGGSDASGFDPGRGARAARARKFPYGDDFLTGGERVAAAATRPAPGGGAVAAAAAAAHARAALAAADADEALSEDSRGGGGAAAAGGGRWAAAAAAAAAAGDEAALPAVVGLHGNKLRIKLPKRPPSAAGAAAGAGTGVSAAARGGGGAGRAPAAPARQDVLALLAAAADGIAPTPRFLSRGADGNGAYEPGSPPPPVDLLSRALVRDAAGAVTGARLALGWRAGSRAGAAVGRRLAAFGQRHAGAAEVESYELDAGGGGARLELRLAAPGNVAALEAALNDLLGAL
jgi:hypothetical protein